MRKAAPQESFIGRLVDRFLGSTPLASVQRIEALKDQPVEVQFTLSHVFIRELIEQFEAYARVENLEQTVADLCRHQLEVFAREELGMPLHPGYFMELNREKWQSGEVSLHDSFYLNQASMLERSQKAALTASDAGQQRRYQGETDQIFALQDRITEQLQLGEVRRIPQGELLSVIRQRYGETTQAYSLGSKLLHTMPKSDVHKGDKAYVNTLQVVYLPHQSETSLSPQELSSRIAAGTYQGRVVTLTEALFYDFSHQDLADIHEEYRSEDVLAEEDVLLRMVTELPDEFRHTRGREIFVQLADAFRVQHKHQGVQTILADQQARETRYNNVQKTIEEGSRFLAQVLLLEMGRATQNDPDFLNFPTRLYYAFGLVASPLLQRLEKPYKFWINFSYRKARENYLTTHPFAVDEQWRSKSVPESLREKVSNDAFLRDVKRISLSTQQKEHYQKSLSSLGGFYLNNIASNTLCNAFSFGNFATSPELLNMGMTQQILQGAPVTQLSSIREILGNTEGWKMGTCVNPSCPNVGVHQLVGPCSICMTCQLRSELDDYQKYLSLGAENTADYRPGMGKTFGGVFDTMNEVRGAYSQYLDPQLILPVVMMNLPLDVALRTQAAGGVR